MDASEEGTPQGASVSPLLSNVYLHYVFDLWADQWRGRHARGDVIIMRFADDFVVGFEHRDDAERFLAELRERFAEFGLELHAGEDAADRVRTVRRRDEPGAWTGKPETFEFLGLHAHLREGQERDGSSSSGSRARSGCGRS